MPDSVITLTQEMIYGKLIPLGIGMLVSLIGACLAACYGVYRWVFHRQVGRIDSHESNINDIDKSMEILAMQLTIVQDNSEKLEIRQTEALSSQDKRHKENLIALELRHKEDLINHRKENDRRITAMEKVNENQMKMLQTYLEQLVKQGKQRRESDNEPK